MEKTEPKRSRNGKRPFVEPVLTKYGDIGAITQALGGQKMGDGAPFGIGKTA
jgi:hypothetical protein